MIYICIYIYLTAVGLTPGGSSTSHIYTQTVHIIQRYENWEVRAVPRLANYTLAFALQLRKKHGKKTSVRVFVIFVVLSENNKNIYIYLSLLPHYDFVLCHVCVLSYLQV
jgi:hypothetical protein